MYLYIAARKYLLPKLESDALAALYASIGWQEQMDSDKLLPGTLPKYQELLRSARLLLFYKEHNPEFKDRAHQIIGDHFAHFFSMKSFRGWLEKKGTEDTLQFVIHSVEQNYSTVI